MSERWQLINAWLATPAGRGLVHAEAQLLADVLDDVFGLEMVQIGAWGGDGALLEHARIRRRTVLADPHLREAAHVLSSLAHLPLGSGVVDAAVLPHTLELAADPHAVLREVDRALAAEGQLVLLGFRPLSPWGVRHRLSRGGFPPGLRRLLGAGRLCDWLGLLSYEIVEVRPYLYQWPLLGARGVSGLGRAPGERSWLYPWPGSAYVIKARKRVYTLTPVRPRWRERRKILSGVMEPTT